MVNNKIIKLGNGKGEWYLYKIENKYVNTNSVVYSFGIGNDISFDLDLISQLNSKIYGFDPTPYAIEWIDSQRDSLPDQFNYYQWAVDNVDRVGKLFPPSKKGLSSYSILERKAYDGRKAIDVEFKRISTIMKELDHSYIDIVKLDIEGAEYRVLEDMIESKIFPDQILVEYHHHNPPLSITDTYFSINLMCSNGYRLVHVSDREREFLFVKSELMS